jgi:hypothetical protein
MVVIAPTEQNSTLEKATAEKKNVPNEPDTLGT